MLCVVLCAYTQRAKRNAFYSLAVSWCFDLALNRCLSFLIYRLLIALIISVWRLSPIVFNKKYEWHCIEWFDIYWKKKKLFLFGVFILHFCFFFVSFCKQHTSPVKLKVCEWVSTVNIYYWVCQYLPLAALSLERNFLISTKHWTNCAWNTSRSADVFVVVDIINEWSRAMHLHSQL